MPKRWGSEARSAKKSGSSGARAQATHSMKVRHGPEIVGTAQVLPDWGTKHGTNVENTGFEPVLVGWNPKPEHSSGY